MKKKYTTPSIEICQLRAQHIIAASGRSTDTNIGFGSNADDNEYGDVKGNSSYNVWDDDWDE